MRFELPECRRCLFCVPLRHGIIIFGYLNLIFSILILTLESWVNWGEPITASGLGIYRGAQMNTHMWLPILLYALEIIFNLILIVGGHKKNKMLMRVYYYYGITTTAAAFVVALISRFLVEAYDVRPSISLFDTVFGAAALVIHVYLLLLIHNELTKPRYRCGTVYVNRAAQLNSPGLWSDEINSP